MEVLFAFDVGWADGLDAVHLTPHHHRLSDQTLDGLDRFASGHESRDRRRPCLPGGDVVVEVAELVEVGDAEEAVSGLDGMVQEREGTVLATVVSHMESLAISVAMGFRSTP